jgi:hypothetical protein
MKNKLVLALAAYVLLAVMAWQTLQSQFRLVTLVILFLLAFKSVMHFWREREVQD